MKTVTLKKKDAYDLSLVIGAIVNEQASTLDFKDIIRLQKEANAIVASIKNFKDGYDVIVEERTQLGKIAQNKLSVFKEKEMKKVEKDGLDAGYKDRVEEYTKMVVDNLQNQINEDLQPKFDKLYETAGNEDVALDMEEDTLKATVDNFALFAKEKYTDKSKMVEVYEVLSSAK